MKIVLKISLFFGVSKNRTIVAFQKRVNKLVLALKPGFDETVVSGLKMSTEGGCQIAKEKRSAKKKG